MGFRWVIKWLKKYVILLTNGIFSLPLFLDRANCCSCWHPWKTPNWSVCSLPLLQCWPSSRRSHGLHEQNHSEKDCVNNLYFCSMLVDGVLCQLVTWQLMPNQQQKSDQGETQFIILLIKFWLTVITHETISSFKFDDNLEKQQQQKQSNKSGQRKAYTRKAEFPAVWEACKAILTNYGF